MFTMGVGMCSDNKHKPQHCVCIVFLHATICYCIYLLHKLFLVHKSQLRYPDQKIPYIWDITK